MHVSRHACGLTNRQAAAIIERVVEGVRRASAEMKAYGIAHPDFGVAAARFAKAYAEGLGVLAEGHS